LSPRLVELNSDEVFEVGHGWFYPALGRLVKRKGILFEEGIFESNRRARFYRFTAERRRQMAVEIECIRLMGAIAQSLRPVEQEGQLWTVASA
jgi:PadR family transcriptional regulator PadR